MTFFRVGGGREREIQSKGRTISSLIKLFKRQNVVIIWAYYENQALILAVFDIVIPILGTLNLILSKTETTIKHNSSFLIKSAM